MRRGAASDPADLWAVRGRCCALSPARRPRWYVVVSSSPNATVAAVGVDLRLPVRLPGSASHYHMYPIALRPLYFKPVWNSVFRVQPAEVLLLAVHAVLVAGLTHAGCPRPGARGAPAAAARA
eukprot:SAG31_NODE_3814_length_3859_cov_5.598936_8_plen_122_part_01